MKYIRTKSCIYEVESVFKEDGFVKGYYVDEMNFIRKDQVVKQSDNLADLCDMFVTLENLDGSVWHSLNFTLCDDLRKDKNNDGVYGAIWTDKGLQFVARMNDKGVLELI